MDLGGNYFICQDALLLGIVLGGVPQGLLRGLCLGLKQGLVVLDSCDEFGILIGIATSIAFLRRFLLLLSLRGFLIELTRNLAELHFFFVLGLPLGQFDVHRREILLLTLPARNLVPKLGIGLAGSLVAFLHPG